VNGDATSTLGPGQPAKPSAKMSYRIRREPSTAVSITKHRRSSDTSSGLIVILLSTPIHMRDHMSPSHRVP